MALCTRSEVYVGLVCPGIGLSQGAADDARRQGAGLRLNTQLVVSLLSKVLWVGLSLTLTNALASVLQDASLCLAGRLWWNQVPRSGTVCLRLAHCRTDSSPGTRRDTKNRVFILDF